ncbi:GNAT family N-acetyltransferase [Lewinella sp. W8]|uniref:GNAT family N-acetyltransferase n=1 Tax=Lewinella sp. W8 TaxID=2528208 RepID=UPI0010677C14|nr:GNAT family N-acetyltransferase [Lewinella sp. W8]MTB53628.1 GNAT family N-acetyltransferase [Lewinella sp. W8]
MTITTREATREDLPVLRQFEQGIILAERPYDPTLKPDPISYYDIGELIDSPEATVIVAEADGRLIGSGYAKKKASRHYLRHEFHAFLGFMFVRPEYRGRGVNQLVLADLLAWARANELHEVRLTVYPDNEPAIRAYEKAGFTPYLSEMRFSLEE